MTRFVLLLRAVNVGTGRKVPMAALRDLLRELGHEDVATYIQSGNVVLSAAAIDRGAIESALADAFGFPIAVIVRTAAELEAAIAANPFVPEGADPARVGVVFLADRPDSVPDIEAQEYLPDRFEIIDAHVHLHCPHGFGRSRLSNDFFERRLGVVATTRNWKTTVRLLEMVTV